jgi:SAM-dependent methyltransferase
VTEQTSANPALIYDSYFVPAVHGPWADVLLERLSPVEGERALDVACGTGAVTLRLAEWVGPHGSVTGLDISPGMLEVARSKPVPDGAAIEWVQGAADHLPFVAESFDLVVCQQSVQFFPDRGAAIREMRRVLTPGGRVGISVWAEQDPRSLYCQFDAALERYLGAPLEKVGPMSFGDPDALGSLLEDAGFSNIFVESIECPVRFKEPNRFAELTIAGAAAVLPEYGALGDEERAALIGVVMRDLDDSLRQQIKADELVFLMKSNMAVARA